MMSDGPATGRNVPFPCGMGTENTLYTVQNEQIEFGAGGKQHNINITDILHVGIWLDKNHEWQHFIIVSL